jgi:hypothetical protein
LLDDLVFLALPLFLTMWAMDLLLADVRQIHEVRRSGVCTCSDLKARFHSKAVAIGDEITAMQNL